MSISVHVKTINAEVILPKTGWSRGIWCFGVTKLLEMLCKDLKQVVNINTSACMSGLNVMVFFLGYLYLVWGLLLKSGYVLGHIFAKIDRNSKGCTNLQAPLYIDWHQTQSAGLNILNKHSLYMMCWWKLSVKHLFTIVSAPQNNLIVYS